MHAIPSQTLSLWMKSIPPFSTGKLTRGLDVDVCVIGGGIAGLTTAYFLALASKRVAVLEKELIGAGETGRSTAHITNVIDDRYFEIEKTHGLEQARIAARAHSAAIDIIEEIVRKESIDCAHRRVNGYLIPGREHDSAFLKREAKAAKRAGLEVGWHDLSPRGTLRGPALVFHNQFQFNPMAYLRGLVSAIERAGGAVYTGTRVTRVDGPGPLVATLENGSWVTADSVVVATNTPFVDRFVMHTKQAAYRTYAIAARIEAELTIDGEPALIWDTEDPYHYVRSTRDSAGNHWLIVGGEDHKTGQDVYPESHWDSLERWMREKFPEAREVAHRWSGQVLEPYDYLGYAGVNPMSSRHLYVISGDSGNGITNGTLGARIVTDLIEGRHNEWAALHSPNRVRIRGLTDYARENANTVAQYADWVKPSEEPSIAQVLPGEAAILNRHGKKLAVYRDASGEAFVCSARCPHLGAVVRWNDAEKSWDCPAHGSRFDCRGKVLNGPAPADLEPESDLDDTVEVPPEIAAGPRPFGPDWLGRREVYRKLPEEPAQD